MTPSPRGDLAALGIAPGGVSRRAFLKRTAMGSAFLVTASVAPTGCAQYPQPPEDFTILSAKEAAVITAVCETLIAGTNNLPAPEDIGFAKTVDDFMATLPRDVQTQLKVLLNAFEHLPIAFAYSFTRFTRMTIADRTQYLSGWASSALAFRRMAFTALRGITFLLYYAHDATWDAIGYDGPWVGRFVFPDYGMPKGAYTASDPDIPLLDEVGR